MRNCSEQNGYIGTSHQLGYSINARGIQTTSGSSEKTNTHLGPEGRWDNSHGHTDTLLNPCPQISDQQTTNAAQVHVFLLTDSAEDNEDTLRSLNIENSTAASVLHDFLIAVSIV